MQAIQTTRKALAELIENATSHDELIQADRRIDNHYNNGTITEAEFAQVLELGLDRFTYLIA